jgi:hypothetical protein
MARQVQLIIVLIAPEVMRILAEGSLFSCLTDKKQLSVFFQEACGSNVFFHLRSHSQHIHPQQKIHVIFLDSNIFVYSF